MILPLLLLAACGPGEPPPVTVSEARPHVVLVTLDTVRADRIGAYGHAAARTETLDALAAAGRRYDRAYAPLPLTIPSHATIFTGLYPPTHGIRSNGGGRLGDEHRTLAEILRDHGWRTAASVGAFVTTRRWGFDQGFDAYFDAVPEAGRNFWHGERPADAVVDDALGWKAQQPPDRPLFLWVHLYDAHFPYVPPDGYVDPDDPRPYDGEIAFVDDQVHRLVDAFAGTPTLFVVAADHGEALGDHGELTHGLYAYAATQRVPLILSGAGVEPAVIDEPTSLADVLPTVLDTLGLPVPEGIEGRVRPSATPGPVYLESWQLAQRFGIAPHVGLVEGRWKLLDTPRPELYDIVADPAEQHDVAAEHADVVAALRRTLAALGHPPPAADADTFLDDDTRRQLAALGYVDAARPVATGATLPDPKDHRELVADLQRAERLLAQQDLDGAIATFASLADRYPDVLEFRLRLASALGHAGRTAEAAGVLRAALDLDPHNPRLAGALAGHVAAEGRFAEAAALFLQAATAMPYSPRLRAQAVAALRRAGKRDDALRTAEAWRARYPDDAHIAGVLGILLVEAGRGEEAVPLLEQGVAASPPEPEVAFHLAAWEVGRGRFRRALDLMQREREHWPQHVRASVVAARLALRVRDWEAQLEAAEAVLAVNPADTEMWYLKVLALFNLSRWREARAAVDRGLAVDPHDPDLMLMDANLLSKEGRRDLGRARFEEAKAALEARLAAAGERSIAEEVGVPDVVRGGAPDVDQLPPWVAPRPEEAWAP